MRVLEQYEPKEALRYFEEICNIPHGSGNMEAISDYCVEFAKAHQLEVIQDELKNVIIVKEATQGYESVPPIILQGHLDMVCEKTLESTIDFEKDPLTLVTDGEFVWAKGTTLGGDDGIAVAYALAVLASAELCHPRIEVVLTVDEEIGLVGAFGVDLSVLKGRRLINIDSEEEGYVWISCAGGAALEGKIPMSFQEQHGVAYDIAVTGLQGGHSGAEIQLGRGNSNLLMGRVLHALYPRVHYNIAALYCGSKDNAIPRHTTATLVIADEDKEILEQLIREQTVILQREYESSDPDIRVTCQNAGLQNQKVLTKDSEARLRQILLNIPNGIQAMSMDIKDLVETSLNIGTIILDTKELTIGACIRSSKESALKFLIERVVSFVEFMGGTSTVSGAYPGWEYKKDSELRDTVVKAYQEIYGEVPQIEAIHAGLECGILSNKLPGLDCVSIGPDMFGVHTYEE
ncbi:MAG: aminoacyl-histidine dipeptidase, partial [Lachnospiraceae bacterium]